MPPSPRPLLAALLAAAALSAAGCGSSSTHATSTTTTTAAGPHTALVSTVPGPEGTPLELGTPLTTPPSIDGHSKDGVRCNTSEQLAYHVHAHLAIFVDGQPRAVPLGIGIQDAVVQQTQGGPFASSGSCFYWLHTHTNDGIVHIESPTTTQYTLGQFFAVWGQPLSTTGVGPAQGTVTAYVNGKPVTGDPSSIVLRPHAEIQLDVGTPLVPPQPVVFAGL